MTDDRVAKLTARQLDVLKQLAKKGVRAHYMPYMGRFNENPYWFIDPGRKVTPQIDALKKRGLVDVESSDQFGKCTTAKINNKGRVALKAELRKYPVGTEE